MYTLKSIARRGTPLVAVVAMVAAAVMPSAAVFADALNPLTERSLLLTSSAPGYVDTDGSGNSESHLNAFGEEYAPPGSGPNGKKTGETFSFRVSTDSTSTPIKAFTLQYCTKAAGLCVGPGNNTGDADPDKDGSTADSNRLLNETATTGGWAIGKSDLNVVGTWSQAASGQDPAEGEYQVYVNGAASTQTWAMAASNKEDKDHTDPKTGKNNFIKLTSATGETPASNGQIKIVFKASTSNFITNPGGGYFFVKMNTYNDDTTQDQTTLLDGGVTVANMMTDSIHITTKVLETMAFSVGTRNRDTITVDCDDPSANTDPNDNVPDCEAAAAVHGPCDVMQNINGNRLDLGDPNAENSLQTDKAWDVYSYWRLSSNSSGGAAVYYSGDTLRNTVGDHIADMPAEAVSTPGMEQFGLGFVDANADTMGADFSGTVSSAPFKTLATGQTDPNDFPGTQTASAAYDEASGTIDNGTGGPGAAKFKFLASSLDTPELIAQENTKVISCATAKMRYVGNIGADTPAGVYTTKINYLAAPQY